MLFVALVARHASDYFFLFDDFRVIGYAGHYPLWAVVGAPLLGFYRPAALLIVRAENWAFGWQAPGGYLAVSLALHALCAGLLFVVSRQLVPSRRVAWVAASLFLLSPWATESYLWVSAQFDLVSALGVVGCMAAGIACRRSAGAGAWGWGATGLAFALVGLFSKENALALPVLVVLVFGMSPCPRHESRRRTAAFTVAVAALTLAYIAARQYAISWYKPDLGVGGSYGTAADLYRQADWLWNALSYLRAAIVWPLPGAEPGIGPPGWAIGVLAVLAAALAVSAFRSSWRLATLFTLACAVSVLPVLWAGLPAWSSASGRLLYAPGAWFSLLLALGIDGVAGTGCGRPAWARRLIAGTLFLVVASLGIASVQRQLPAWRSAASLSRASIEQFGARLPFQKMQVFIPNLPFWSIEGPYVLKDYAFSHYFAGQMVPFVRGRPMTLSLSGEQARFVGWAGSQTPSDSVTEETFFLDLPIEGMPLPGELRPARLSVFVTADGRRRSDARVRFDAPGAGPWRIDLDATDLFTVEPSRGQGSADLEIVPAQTDDGPVDRTVTLPIRAAASGGRTIATLTVRFQVVDSSSDGPPMGSVDLPPDPIPPGPGPIVLQGWAVDDVGLRRVWAEAVDARGDRHHLGLATRGGERADISALFPSAHDLFNAGWALAIAREVLAPHPRPLTLEVYAEDVDGRRTQIGARTLH